MPEVLGSPPSPRAALFWNGTAWEWALVDAAGHLQIDTVTSALPAGAATEATLASADAYLGLIAVLWNCLRTVGTDRFMVKGEDQLFSYKEPLLGRYSAVISGAGGYIASGSPAAGLVWKITNVHVVDATSPTTAHTYLVLRAPTDYVFERVVAAMALNVPSFYHGEVWIEPGDVIRVFFEGGQVADNCFLSLTGYEFTKE